MTDADDTELQKQIEKKQNRKARPGGLPRLRNLPRGWLHQGFFYLDRTQRLCRMLFETMFLLLLTGFLRHILELSYSNYLLWIASAFITHTFFWIFDGNWWAGMMFTFPWLRNPGEDDTVEYLNKMGARLAKSSCISGVLVYGSIARGEWHDRSDLDVRFLRRPGLLNGFFSVLTLYRERIIALIKRQPLDVYIADSVDFLKKMREDEKPVILKKKDQRLDSPYPGNEPLRLKNINFRRNV